MQVSYRFQHIADLRWANGDMFPKMPKVALCSMHYYSANNMHLNQSNIWYKAQHLTLILTQRRYLSFIRQTTSSKNNIHRKLIAPVNKMTKTTKGVAPIVHLLKPECRGGWVWGGAPQPLPSMGDWGHCLQKILKFNSANLFIFSTISRQRQLFHPLLFYSFTAYICK